MRTRILLTGVGEILKKEASERLKNSHKESEPKCNNGHTKEFYEDLGVDLPEDLTEKLNAQTVITEDDWEETYAEVVVYEDEIKFIVTDESGTTIFLKDDMTLEVIETAEEIYDYLDYIHNNKIKKIGEYLEMSI